jgi:hypothetical protein
VGDNNYIYSVSLDVDTSFLPTTSTDLDGSVSSPKSLSYSITKEKELFLYLENSYGGAFSGEGGRDEHRLDFFKLLRCKDLILILLDTRM